MPQNAPKGYSLNHYPPRWSRATHRVQASGRVPVYDKYFETLEPPSPSQNSGNLVTFLSSGTEVVVLDEHVGRSGAWTEIMIPGDESASTYNLFIFNNKLNPVLVKLPLTLPSARYAEVIETRDYANSIFSYDNRPANQVFHDAGYKHYVVKISQSLNSTNKTMDEMLQDAISDGAQKICSEYGVSLPEYTYEYLSQRLFDFFNIFHYTVDLRGNNNVNIASLVCYVTIRSKYLDPLIPNVTPTTSDIAKQEPQYRRAEAEGRRVNEHIDPWLDPARSPLDSENFMKQYIKNFKDQTKKDLDFTQSFEDLYARGTKKPWNLPSIVAEELSELPIVGSSWQENQRNQQDRARSDQAIANQDLERAIGDTLEKFFGKLGLNPANTRKAREAVRGFTAKVIATGAKIEDINDLIDSTVDTLKNTPDVFNMETGEFNAAPSEIIAALNDELGLADALYYEPDTPYSEESAKKTISAAINNNQPLGKFFKVQVPDSPGVPIAHSYPLAWQVDDSYYTKNFVYDNLFSFVEREGLIYSLQEYILETLKDLRDPEKPDFSFLIYRVAVNRFVSDIFEQEIEEFSKETKPGSLIGTYYNNKDIFNKEKVSLRPQVGISQDELQSITESLINFENDDFAEKRLNKMFEYLDSLEKTYIDDPKISPVLYKEESFNLYQIASKTVNQSRLPIPKIRIKANNELEFLNENGTVSWNKEFTGLWNNAGMSTFYAAVKRTLEKHKENKWKIEGLTDSDLKEIEAGVNKVVRTVLAGLIRKNIPNLLKNGDSVKDVILDDANLSLAFDKKGVVVFAHLSCVIRQKGAYEVFAFEGAQNEKYDIKKILSPVSYDEQVGEHLFLNNVISDYVNADTYIKSLKPINMTNHYNSGWRDLIKTLFSKSNVIFTAPSEQPEIIARNAAYRTLYQNTKGRTEKQQKDIIRSIKEFKGATDPDDYKSNTDSIREGIADFAIPLTRAGDDAFTATFRNTEELADELMTHIGLDTPVLQPFIKCLFPEIDFEKILQDTEQYKLIKDMQDSILATAEASMAALDLYDTLEALFTPSEGEGGLKELFLAALDKAIDLLILEAFKASLEYIQTLCLKWQAFLMEVITNALLGKAIEKTPSFGPTAGRSLPGTTGTTSSIGNGVISSLTLKGYTQNDIEILSSPEAIRYIEDLSTLLTPSEFCQLMTKDDAPGYLKDVAYNLYDEMYKETILSNLDDKDKIYSFLRVMGEFIDPRVCEAMARTSRLPVRGYSHTRCTDRDEIQDVKEQIMSGTAVNPDELRKILDNTAAKNAQDLKTMLVGIEEQASGRAKIDLNPDRIFENLPEVKQIRKKTQLMKNNDLVTALTIDANEYNTNLTESGKEYYEAAKHDLVLGPMGKIYRQFATAQINEKLKLSINSSDEPIPETVGEILNEIIQRDDDGLYTYQDKEALAAELRDATGLEFNEKDIDILRISNVRSPQKVFDNIRSADSESDSRNPSYDVEGLELNQYDYQKQRFLDNVRQYIDAFTYEEKERIIEQLKVHPWRIAIGIYDNHKKRNIYHTSSPGDYTEVMKYLPDRSQEDYSYDVPLYTIGIEDNVTPENLYDWLEESTNKTADYFFAKYKDEEEAAKAAHVIFVSFPLLNRDGSDFYVNSEPLQSFREISIIKEPTPRLVAAASSKFKIHSNGDLDFENLSDNFIKIDKNENLKKGNPENYSRDNFFLYREDGKKYAGGIIRGINSEKKMKSEIFPTKALEERTNLIEKNVRDIVSMKREYLFGTTSSTTTQEDQERELLHFLMKQGVWFSHTSNDTDIIYGQKIFKMLNSIRESFTEYQSNGDYKNLLPDIITEHLLGMMSIDKHLSDYENLKEKFKSPFDFVDSSAEFERRDYSVEEKVDIWLSVKFFVLTFVADYYLKILPLATSEGFFTESSNNLAKQIILSNIEVFLQEERGPDFEIFRIKFLYYATNFWLYLQQEKCSPIDVTGYSNPMTAVSNIVEDMIEDVQNYLKDNGLMRASKTQSSQNEIFRLPLLPFDLDIFNDKSDEDNKWKVLELLAKYYGEKTVGVSMYPDPGSYNETIANLWDSFRDKIENNGMIFIVPEIIEEKVWHRRNEFSSRKISPSEFGLQALQDPQSFASNRWTSLEYYLRYKISLSVKVMTPETMTASSGLWTKTENDELERGFFPENSISTLHVLKSTEYFFDTQDPFQNGLDIWESPWREVNEYKSSWLERMNEQADKLSDVLKKTPIYKKISETLNLLDETKNDTTLETLIYYSFYDYFENLGNRNTFYNTREAAMNKLLKADARGTEYENIPLPRPTDTSTEVGPNSDEMTFFEMYTSLETQEDWKYDSAQYRD